MLSIQGIATPPTRENCSLCVVRPLIRSLHLRNHVSSRPMPAEVVSNIIRSSCDPSRDPISQSISCSHVCKQWRQIALSDPSLWICIFLSLPLSKNQIMRTITCLARSRNCPLDIYMDFRDPSWDWDETTHDFGSTAMDNIMRLLVPQAARWRSIQLFTDTWAPIFTFLSFTTGIRSTPRLESIRLARCNEYFVSQGETFRPANLAFPIAWFDAGASLSHLQHVSLSGVHVDWKRSGLSGLRELELRYHAQEVVPTLSDFRLILDANRALERLVILGWGARMDPTWENERGVDGPSTTDLPLLEELEIGFVDMAHSIKLVSLLSLPKLRVLAIEDLAFGMQLCERQNASPLFDHIVELNVAGQFSFSSLHDLSLRNIHADDVSIQTLLGRLPVLTLLGLDHVHVATLLAICSTLHACDRLEALTLKDVDPAVATLLSSSFPFPPRLRIFLDVDDVDETEHATESSIEDV